MKNVIKSPFYILQCAVFVLISCGKDSPYVIREDADEALEYLDMLDSLNLYNGINHFKSPIPDYLVSMGLIPRQIDDKKATLGRVLFYDKNLSADKTISCASCHRQDKAFSDVSAVSTGIFGQKTLRNSSPLANTVHFQTHYQAVNGAQPLLFWDHRASDVRHQSAQTFENPLEMGMPMHEVVARVRSLSHYPYLWKQAFGHFEPTEAELLESLEAFVGAMGAGNSRFDQAMTATAGIVPEGFTVDTIITMMYYGTTPSDTTIITLPVLVPGFTVSETRGLRIFVDNCSNCHSPIRTFQEVFAACNGLDADYHDEGLGAVTGRPEDMGVFKSPSLRNIALTAPYMHDGRFKTLDEVVNFYSVQVASHPNLHPSMKKNLVLSMEQRADLVAFLHTLTDVSITKDEDFKSPFKQ
ncbi:MAG: cytochrome c peroxidase [Saprospiraceae bacterium]|nr:cytochrome c peroxidase [Saprospiraceae bacterium]